MDTYFVFFPQIINSDQITVDNISRDVTFVFNSVKSLRHKPQPSSKL